MERRKNPIPLNSTWPSNYPASFAFTSAETLDMSAFPASLPLRTPITLPMSVGPLAPAAAIKRHHKKLRAQLLPPRMF